jgi:CMP-N-acetylneuraminic acid synthetase
MKILAIIPARGGSKGIPRKNITPLLGKPLISYIIEAAKASKYINQIVVSTDDAEIASISVEYGVEICMRPPEISGDHAKSEDALLHVLSQYSCDIVVFLQCTSPLTATEDIDGTIEALLNNNTETALSVIPFHYFLWTPDGNGINHDKRIRLLRQEREPQYLETGAIYVMRAEGFLKTKHRFFGTTAIYETPAERRLEIDEPFDLEMAKIIMQKRKNHGC